MRRRIGRIGLALAVILAIASIAVPDTETLDFEATPVNALLNPEREAGSSGKVPPLTEAIRTKDGRVRVLIELQDPPLARYQGGISGFQATSPKATGSKKLDLSASHVAGYREMLASRQATAEAACAKVAPSAQMLARFDVLFNGFGVAVDEAEIQAIADLPDVARVYPDRMVYASMDASLPLIKAPKFWNELGGRDVAGAGVKVAVVDGGIRPENPMFSGTGFSYPPGFPLADDYCGTVDPGFCNGKLIAARQLPDGRRSIRPRSTRRSGSTATALTSPAARSATSWPAPPVRTACPRTSPASRPGRT